MMSSMPFKKIALIACTVLWLQGGTAQAQNVVLNDLVASAAQWAALADANQGDRMWDSSGPIMQRNMQKPEWAMYLGNLRKEVGIPQTREWTQVTRVTNPPGLPPGDYMNVMFNTTFSRMLTVEKVSLAATGGRWLPVGYVVTPAVQPTTATSRSGQ